MKSLNLAVIPVYDLHTQTSSKFGYFYFSQPEEISCGTAVDTHWLIILHFMLAFAAKLRLSLSLIIMKI